MARLAYTIASPLPPAEAFARVADFGRLAEWDPGVAAVERLTPGPTAAGSRFRLLARFLGSSVAMEYELVDWDPPRHASYVGRTRRVTSRDEIRCRPAGSGAELEMVADIGASGWLRAMEPLLVLAMRWQGRASLRALRRHVGG